MNALPAHALREDDDPVSDSIPKQDASQLAHGDDEPVSDSIPIPDISELIIEDDEPVDSILSEKEQRLLTEPLYTSWSGPPPERDGERRVFAALANVGVFTKVENWPLVPDAMLSVDVEVNRDLSQKENNSYFVWKFGKPPDVVIEIVSNKRGGELGKRFHGYRKMRVPYYVVYDPVGYLGEGRVVAFELRGDVYKRMEVPRFETLGLMLAEWTGSFENTEYTWLRWFTLDGELVLTGAERAEQERQRAEQAQQHAEQAQQHADQAQQHADQARQHAEQAQQRAEQALQRAEQAQQRAEQAEERARRLMELLRAQGIDPDHIR